MSAEAVAAATLPGAQAQQVAQDTPSAKSIQDAIAAAAAGHPDPLNTIVSEIGDDNLGNIANGIAAAMVKAHDPTTLANLVAAVLATGDSTLVATLVVVSQAHGLKGSVKTWGQALARSKNPDLVRSVVGQAQQLSQDVGNSLQRAVIEEADAGGYYGITEAASNPTTAPVLSPPPPPPP